MNNLFTLSKPAIQYLCQCINLTASVSEAIDDLNLRSDGVMSSVKVDKLIKQCLQDANDYSDEVVNALTHLVAEKIDFEPTLDNTTDKLNTLLLYSKNSDNNYTQYLRLTNELLNLGDTSLDLSGYIKKIDAEDKFVLKTSYDDLVTKVNEIDGTIGTETLTTTSTTLTGAINELFQSVSNGKTLVASAITDKGVDTLATDTFQTMANNISNIMTGDLINLAVIYSALNSHGLTTRGDEDEEEIARVIRDLLTPKTLDETTVMVEDFTDSTDNTIHENAFVETTIGKISIEPKELLFVDNTDYIEYEEISKSEYATSVLLA